MEDKSYVYWLYLNGFSLDDGYIGVTKYPEKRIKHHLKNNPNVDSNSQYQILFEGTREECFALENKLRPRTKMGWNNAIGGAQGFKLGFRHSEETCQKLKDSWTDERRLERSLKTIEQNKSFIGQKRPKQSAAMLGDKNPMYGKERTEETKRKISESNIGKAGVNKQELYCIHCKQRVSQHILNKYHGLGKKNCISKIKE